MTTVLPATAEAIDQAATLLRTGEIVVFPTETVYGLGALAASPAAVARVFAAKARPPDDPLIVHVTSGLLGATPSDGLERLGLCRLDAATAARVDALAGHFWPGPLTLLLPRGPAVPDAVTAGLPEVAVRVPLHPAATALIDRVAAPLVAPSANRFGRISPTTAAAALAELEGRVPLILDGGPCEVGLESTVLRPSVEDPRVLRPGAITTDALARVLGAEPAVGAGAGPHASPGLMDRHYAPRTPMVTWTGGPLPPGRVAVLAWSPASVATTWAPLGDRITTLAVLSPDGTTRAAARHLYGALRHLDDAGCDTIVAEPVPDLDGLTVALRDRLRRSMAGSR